MTWKPDNWPFWKSDNCSLHSYSIAFCYPGLILHLTGMIYEAYDDNQNNFEKLLLFVVALHHNNSIWVISWLWYHIWDEKEKAWAYTFTDSSDLYPTIPYRHCMRGTGLWWCCKLYTMGKWILTIKSWQLAIIPSLSSLIITLPIWRPYLWIAHWETLKHLHLVWYIKILGLGLKSLRTKTDKCHLGQNENMTIYLLDFSRMYTQSKSKSSFYLLKKIFDKASHI